MKTIGIGLVGSGFMGRCHANAYSSVAGLFNVPLKPKLKMLAEANTEFAKEAARSLKFELIFAFNNKSETKPFRAKREILHKLLH